MFLGHYAVAFAAKRAAPRTSLGTLFFAAQFLDLIWPILLLAGIETVRIEPGSTRMTPLEFTSYPISHSLLTVVVWSVLVGAAYFWRRRACRAAIVIGLAVLSHWVLDWISHRPDLPLAPGSDARAGLGLWNRPALAVGLETILFLFAVGSYLTGTRAKDAIGRYGLSALLVFLTGVYVLNLNAPPPPNEQALAVTALALWLLVPWAAWVDRHRKPRSHTSHAHVAPERTEPRGPRTREDFS